MSKTCFFTIVSNNYRHFARTLVASVRRYSPEIDAFVAICDNPAPVRDPRDDYREIAIRELGLPKFDRFIFQYTILELNTAIKPWVIGALFERGYERVIYFDPDIKLYGRIDPILARLDDANVVLTPHLTGRLDDGKHPSELAILQSGSYNLGFIALRRCDETKRFVEWWQGKLMRDCVVDIARGLFTDQKWIDLVPGMYSGIAIERDPGWNVAYWNLNHRRVEQTGVAFTANGRPLLFFHFSGFAPGGRLLSKHQDRFTMESLPAAVRALATEYADDLRLAGDEECRAAPYGFGRLRNGEAIPDLVRRCYREGFSWDEPHPDLWTPEGQSFVIDWLNRPSPLHRRSPWLTRVAETFYRTRPDVQAAFPDVTGSHGPAYGWWFVENAGEQAGIGRTFTEPVRRALDAGRSRRSASAAVERSATTTGPHAWPGVATAVETSAAMALDVADAAEGVATRPTISRRVYQVAYRAAWRVRHAIKPFTSQRVRHIVRHSLLRKAYFDDRYQIPPLVPSPDASASRLLEAADSGADSAAGHWLFAPGPGAGSPLDGAEGLNLIGYLTAESGVGESARSTLRILEAAGIPVTPIEFRVGNLSRMDETLPDVSATEHLHPINLFHINADQMFVARQHLGQSLLAGRYNIGYWAWELPEFPDEWVPALGLLDEVWVPSAFCQQAIATKSPVPVLRVPHSVEAPSVAADREAFGIDERDVAFFAMCDVLSVPERKNPFGVAETFRRAFPGNEAVRLLLKITNLEHQPDLSGRLRRLIAGDPRIRLLEGYLPRSELWTLMASIDCFVSLHRSEGFGLGMAEAMACGCAVIATGWSGNVDFTRHDNALLVAHRLVELERDLGPYRRGQLWAEPDIDAAADCMRQIVSSADLRRQLGVRARETVARELSPMAIAPLVRARLKAIGQWR